MQVIFVGLSGVYQALIAARVFIEGVSGDDTWFIQHFGDREVEKRGEPYYVGQDSCGVRVYTLGAGRNQQLAAHVIEELRDLLGFGEKELTVRVVSLPGEKVLAALDYIPAYIGGACLQKLLGQLLIERQLERIKEETLAHKAVLTADGWYE